MSKNNTSYVQTFSKGLQILEFLAEKHTTTVTTLAKNMGLQKSASYRFLNTLRLHGYVEQDDNNNYGITDRLTKLSRGVVPKLEFYTVATRILNQLTKNYPNLDAVANLGFWNGKEIVYRAQSAHNNYMQFHEGSTIPAYCSALGKAILAFLPQQELIKYLNTTNFEKFTEHTTSSKEELELALELVRQHGYATMSDELCLGLKGVAVPLKQENTPIKYAVSLTQTLYGEIDPLITKSYPLLSQSAEEISQHIDLGIYNPIK